MGGATNMRDHLDKALLRPGRFDNQVEVGKPDVKGRREILGLYMSKIKHDDSIDVESIASRTTGFAGADLQQLVNSATIHAATENKDYVGQSDFEWAYDKQTMGTEWKSRVRPKEDLEITAYHEAGHTLVALLTKDSMPLHKVTILAKGGSGGHTGFTPTENMQWHQAKSQMKARMDVAMGGRVAEELIFGTEKTTGGASSDLSMATSTAVNMVKRLGMSEKVGLRVQYDDPVQNMEYGPSTRELTDEEINRLLNESYKRATNLLTKHKKELRDVVEFLMNPDKFSALGGKLPKGCLLVGPPGTGKTLLARAVAGEAGVPFFYASGSEFDEVLVGQGARRVRDLFKAAKERAPCVIFLDEIDSVGGKRSSSDLHPYANQTINQLLNEMDGFVSNEGVIVLGATNMRDHLDKALLRPGRFDNQVEVGKPDVKGRREILGLYMSKIKHDDSIDVESIASRTTGFAGADLQQLVNSATIHAATENKDYVGQSDFEWAYDKQVTPTYIIELHHLHCSHVGPHLGTWVPMGTFFRFWVPIGSPFVLQGPHFLYFKLKSA